MTFVDLLVVFVVLLGIYAEVTRGLFLALFDLLRIGLGLGMGLLGYSLVHRLTHSYPAGLGGFVVIALLVVGVLAYLMNRSKLDPKWGKTPAGRIGAGVVGSALGFSICLFLIPVLGRFAQLEPDVRRSPVARVFLSLTPGMYYAADAANIDLPQFSRRPIRFEDEGRSDVPTFTDRINYLHLDQSMCIECRAPVNFQGYRMKVGVSFSPKFQCPVCGRTSDGCQTFEGFHRMYGLCPIQVAQGRIAIDCGVWPNDRPVQPRGLCPVDGRAGSASPGSP